MHLDTGTLIYDACLMNVRGAPSATSAINNDPTVPWADTATRKRAPRPSVDVVEPLRRRRRRRNVVCLCSFQSWPPLHGTLAQIHIYVHMRWGLSVHAPRAQCTVVNIIIQFSAGYRSLRLNHCIYQCFCLSRRAMVNPKY